MTGYEGRAAPFASGSGLVSFAGGFASELASVLAGSAGDRGAWAWLPAGVLLAVLVRAAPSRWLSCTAGVLAGVVLAMAVSEGTTAGLAPVTASECCRSAFGDASPAQPLLVLAALPLLVSVALRARLASAYAFASVFAIVATVALPFDRAGGGPFVEPEAAPTALALLSGLPAVGFVSWLLAMLAEQRVEMRRALAHLNREHRALAGRLIEAQEHERTRIARDLHDDVNQRLASASIALSAIRRSVGPQNRAALAELHDELIALSDDVRRISHNLHPAMLRETGLAAAIGALCDTLRRRGGPAIDLCVTENADHFPDAIALCLYRAAQEALGNAVRHARARAIDVRLAIVDEHAELRVDDDGIGFDAAADATRRRGLGLVSLEERATLLGGTFRLTTTPGKGTRACMRIPLRSPRPR